ncbi:MAG: FAD-dependent oxidoreductase, partial [Gallionellaceae bacterium]
MKDNVPCQAACPAGTNIPAYIRMISEERIGRSYELNRLANVLPGVLGRICSRPCEDACRHAWPGNGESVAICYLKRYAADQKPTDHRNNESLFTPTGKNIAVVGAGPAGIAAAYDLTTLGHDVTLYEREEKPGGMLAYGIPEFRLPRDILAVEIHNAMRMGVQLKTGVPIGNGVGDVKLSTLHHDHDAVLLATGCMAATPLPLSDMDEEINILDIEGVYYGLDFLVDMHRGKNLQVGKRVAIVGAGFTAFDCARVARRQGAEEVTIHLRTGEEYIPVPSEEIFEAKKEGVKINGLRSPVGVITDKHGRLRGIRFIQNRLGGWRAEGRRKALGIEGSEFEIECDTLLIAIGKLTV